MMQVWLNPTKQSKAESRINKSLGLSNEKFWFLDCKEKYFEGKYSSCPSIPQTTFIIEQGMFQGKTIPKRDVKPFTIYGRSTKTLQRQVSLFSWVRHGQTQI
jgi:hypothetical protein